MGGLVFFNSLTLGGSEKAGCLWAGYMAARIREREEGRVLHFISAVALEDGPRRADLERSGVPLRIPGAKTAPEVAEAIADADVIHAHAPGFPHQGDILGAALRHLGRKIPVVQTNIFGKLQNPAEDAWTDFRLFISWTSCVQAARRAGRKLNREFFRHQSVAVYPLEDTVSGQAELATCQTEAALLRQRLGLRPGDILFGRFSRPEPNKWTPLVVDAFLAAHRENPRIRLLLREPPPEVARHIKSAGLSPRVLMLPATSEAHSLAVSQMACDAVLHTSSIGESFGYGVAELMAMGKPVITNSVPWHDQAQIELVRPGECGLVASTAKSMKMAVLQLAADEGLRTSFGAAGRRHILSLADPQRSTDRLEIALQCALTGQPNPCAEEDLDMARKAAEYLDKHQWGHSIEESTFLRTQNFRWNFLKWQRALRDRVAAKEKPKPSRENHATT
jgi:glycosyltransferase involved in cell wall biosynthesis